MNSEEVAKEVDPEAFDALAYEWCHLMRITITRRDADARSTR
jgi:hypothetical protein